MAIKDPPNIISHRLDPQKKTLRFFYKDKNDRPYINHQRLKSALEEKNKIMVFAVNGGMYNKDLSPQGLYIENGKEIAPKDTLQKGYGNFYLQPNGVFYLDKEYKAHIIRTSEYSANDQTLYATQSGPMLLIDGAIHPEFRKGSKNLHIRNGVGLLPNGELLFAMSKERINFFDFATYFKSQGCKNALYLDGFVSRTYLPEKNWEQLDGKYGIIIAEINTEEPINK